MPKDGRDQIQVVKDRPDSAVSRLKAEEKVSIAIEESICYGNMFEGTNLRDLIVGLDDIQEKFEEGVYLFFR